MALFRRRPRTVPELEPAQEPVAGPRTDVGRLLTLRDHQVVQRTAPGVARVAIATPGDGQVVARASLHATREFTATAVSGRAVLELPVGGPYEVELHGGNGSWTLARDVLVGDLWVLAGGANMSGAAPFGDDLAPHAHLRLHDPEGLWRSARDPLHERWPDPLIPRGVGPGVSFGNALLDERGIPVGLIAAAATGTRISDWDPDLAGPRDDAPFGFLRRSVLLAGGRVAGMVWYHGELDAIEAADTGLDVDAYAVGLRTVIREFRQVTVDPTLPVHLVQLGQYNGQHRRGTRMAWQDIQGVQSRFQEVGADSVTATVDLRLCDTTHLGLEAQRRLGRRLALAANGRGTIMVERIRRTASNRLIVDFANVARAFDDPGPVVAFSIHDQDQRDVEIVLGAHLTGKTQVTIDLERAPEAGESLWYGYGTTPYCQLVDRRDRALPAFGPVALT